MPTPTYDLIARNVLSSNTSTVTFSSISSTYRDLVLVINALGTSALVGTTLRFNGDSGNNYSSVVMYGTGSTTASNAGTGTSINAGDLFDTEVALHIHNIMDYAQTNKHKPFIVRKDVAEDSAAILAGRWQSTSAITSIELAALGGSYITGSNFSLYGIV